MIHVFKSSGSQEPFDENKILDSMHRANISQHLQEKILTHVKTKLYENIPTSEIYHHISEFLETSSSPYSKTRYGLKRGIMDLGPTGYPFEDFVGEVLKAQGYQTQTRQILKGKCVTHEIDIIAQKDATKSMIECKFHNSMGTHTQIHVSLYTKARFDDLKDIHNFNDCWLVTNTRITPDALSYALCSNIKVISWNYPEGKGLRDLVEKSQLHPITVLSTLSQNQKQSLFQKHVVLCKDIARNPKLISELNLSEDQLRKIVEETMFVCPIA